MNKYAMHILSFALILLAFAAPYAHAEKSDVLNIEGWQKHTSQTGLFSINMPSKLTAKQETMPVSNNLLILKENITSQIDYLPIKDAKKHHIIRAEQTLGIGLSKWERASLLKKNIEQFKKHYASKNPVVVEERFKTDEHPFYAEVMLVYSEKNKTTQAVKTRITYSDSTKLQAVYAGPDQTIESRWTNNFFDSVLMNDGLVESDSLIKDEWASYRSDLNSYSVLYPNVLAPYLKAPPQISMEKEQGVQKETFSLKFYDPVRYKPLLYNIYAYKTDESFSFDSAEKFLTKNHVPKHTSSIKNIEFDRTINLEKPQIITTFKPSANDHLPYNYSIRLSAQFFNGYIVIQELYGTENLMKGALASSLINSLIFHPEEALRLDLNSKSVVSVPEASPEAADQDLVTTQ